MFITGCTGSCQNDNFQCSQWWKFRQNDDIFVSVSCAPKLIATNHASFGIIALLKMCLSSHSIPCVTFINHLHSSNSGLLIQLLVNCWWKHWNRNVIKYLVKISSLTATIVVILTTHCAANDANFVKMIIFQFQLFGSTWPQRTLRSGVGPQ